MVAPPVARTSGCRVSLFNVGGRSVNWLEADTPLSVAVSVISVGAVTCPNLIGSSRPGVGTRHRERRRQRRQRRVRAEEGHGGATRRDAGGQLHCPPFVPRRCTRPAADCPVCVIDTGVAGAELIVKRPVVDQSVMAFVVGDDSPC